MAPTDKSAPGSRVKRRKGPQGTPLGVLEQATKRAMFHCNNCQRDISNCVRIRCAECTDFDLCLPCFSVGVNIYPHRNDHEYRVVDNLAFPIFHPDWGADEEMLLLEAIDMVGLGNWDAVATHVATKTSEQCMQHYHDVYLASAAFPQAQPAPEMAHLDAMQVAEHKWRQRRITAAQQLAADAAALIKQPPASIRPFSAASTPTPPPMPHSDPTKAAVPMIAPPALHGAKQIPNASGMQAIAAEGTPGPAEKPGPAMAVKAEIHKLKEEEGQAEAHPSQGSKQPAGRETGERGLPGMGPNAMPADPVSMPESATSGQPGPDPASERVIKVHGNQVEITGYQARRNEFEPEYDNAAEAVVADLEFKEDDTEEERADKLQLVAIYNERLTEREYRRAVIIDRGLLNVKRFQALEKRWGQAEKEVHLRMRAFARYMPQGEHEALADGLINENRLRARIAELQEARRAGIRTLTEADAHATESRAKRPASAQLPAAELMTPAPRLSSLGEKSRSSLSRSISALDGVAAAMLQTSVPSSLPEPPLPRSSSSVQGAGAHGWVAAAVEADPRGTAAALASDKLRLGATLDISGLPGLELLSLKERELCASERLLPAHYLAAKAALLAYDAQNSNGAHDAGDEVRACGQLLNAQREAKVHNLLHACGWVQSHGALPHHISGSWQDATPMLQTPMPSLSAMPRASLQLATSSAGQMHSPVLHSSPPLPAAPPPAAQLSGLSTSAGSYLHPQQQMPPGPGSAHLPQEQLLAMLQHSAGAQHALGSSWPALHSLQGQDDSLANGHTLDAYQHT